MLALRLDKGPAAGLATALLFSSILSASVHASGQERHHKPGKVQYGTASWYGGPHEQGRTTACGQPFNEHALTAAHKTLPLGTRVKVTNLRNGRSVTVRIIDRGPWVAGRMIDLSRAAARRLDFAHKGLAPVKVQVLRAGGEHPSCRASSGTDHPNHSRTETVDGDTRAASAVAAQIP